MLFDQFGIEIQVPPTPRDGSNSWIVISRGPNRYVDDSWHDQDDSPDNGGMVSSTSVERSHAMTSSIEETRASKPQAQSSLMNYFSKELIEIDEKKWNDIPACDTVERSSLGWNISKRLTAFCDIETLMIEKLTEQFIGVLCIRRHDVRSEVKVLELSLTLNGWVISTEEAKKTGFNVAQKL